MVRITVSLMLLTLAGTGAFAGDKDHRWNHCEKHGCVAAPEIDPTQAVSALMLLGGAVAVLRGRRRKK